MNKEPSAETTMKWRQVYATKPQKRPLRKSRKQQKRILRKSRKQKKLSIVIRWALPILRLGNRGKSSGV